MKLLFVEDEKELSNAMCTVLKEKGYDVTPSYDGEDAYNQIHSNTFDLIVLDIMLPNINGLDLLAKIRKEKNKTPVIMLTALADEETKIKGLDNGADDYITKPFSVNELIARIKAILRRTEKEESNILTYGDLSLNLENYDLFTSKKRIRVSSKEYNIIKLFLENPNKVLAKSEIVSAIWNTDEELESNSVEVYLSFIRRKLLFIGTKVNIASVRGVGYRLEEDV